MKFIATKPLRYPESGGIEDYGYIQKETVCETAVVEGCEAILHEGKAVCDVDSGMAGEYFREDGVSMEELKVKAGDKVLYHYWTFGGTVERIEIVTRVTPTGRIRIEGSGSQFDKYGREMGCDSWRGGANLSIPTEEDCKRIEENSVISRALSLMEKLNKKTLPYDKAVKIIEILEDE